MRPDSEVVGPLPAGLAVVGPRPAGLLVVGPAGWPVVGPEAAPVFEAPPVVPELFAVPALLATAGFTAAAGLAGAAGFAGAGTECFWKALAAPPDSKPDKRHTTEIVPRMDRVLSLAGDAIRCWRLCRMAA